MDRNIIAAVRVLRHALQEAIEFSRCLPDLPGSSRLKYTEADDFRDRKDRRFAELRRRAVLAQDILAAHDVNVSYRVLTFEIEAVYGYEPDEDGLRSEPGVWVTGTGKTGSPDADECDDSLIVEFEEIDRELDAFEKRYRLSTSETWQFTRGDGLVPEKKDPTPIANWGDDEWVTLGAIADGLKFNKRETDGLRRRITFRRTKAKVGRLSETDYRDDNACDVNEEYIYRFGAIKDRIYSPR